MGVVIKIAIQIVIGVLAILDEDDYDDNDNDEL